MRVCCIIAYFFVALLCLFLLHLFLLHYFFCISLFCCVRAFIYFTILCLLLLHFCDWFCCITAFASGALSQLFLLCYCVCFFCIGVFCYIGAYDLLHQCISFCCITSFVSSALVDLFSLRYILVRLLLLHYRLSAAGSALGSSRSSAGVLASRYQITRRSQRCRRHVSSRTDRAVCTQWHEQTHALKPAALDARARTPVTLAASTVNRS